MKTKSLLLTSVGIIIACSALKAGEADHLLRIINKVNNRGFEVLTVNQNGLLEVEQTVGDAGSAYIPTTFGDWAGDNSRIVQKSNGIKPFEGKYMLQFLNTGGTPAISTDHVSQVRQLVDVSPNAETSAAGGSTGVYLGASFNQVKSKHPSQFGVAVLAFEGDPAAAPTLINGAAQIAQSQGSVSADNKASTWEQAKAPILALPAATDFISGEIQAKSGVNVLPGNLDANLAGQYADNVVMVFFKLPLDGESITPFKGKATFAAFMH